MAATLIAHERWKHIGTATIARRVVHNPIAHAMPGNGVNDIITIIIADPSCATPSPRCCDSTASCTAPSRTRCRPGLPEHDRNRAACNEPPSARFDPMHDIAASR